MQEVADIDIVPVPNAIYREDLARRLHVEADVEGRDLGSVVAEVEAVLETVDFPLGYSAVMLGEFAERQEASQRIMVAALVAGLIIFLLSAHLSRQLADGDAVLLEPTGSPGGWYLGSLDL